MVVSMTFPHGKDLQFAVTGNVSNTFAASSNNNVSAVGHGPWFIETQKLNIEYERVPTFSRELLQDRHVTLSSIDPVSGSTSDTFLICKVNATYQAVSSNAYYSSGLQVPQKFTCYPVSGDYHGDTYGDLDPLSGTMGPQGKVLTTQEWYQRRLWTASDVEVTQSTNGNYYNFDSGFWMSGTTANSCFGNYREWLEYRHARDFGVTNGWVDLFEVIGHPGTQHELYRLPGQYGTVQENNARYEMISMIDQLSYMVKGIGGNIWDNEGVRLNTIPEDQVRDYESWRHDYS